MFKEPKLRHLALSSLLALLGCGAGQLDRGDPSGGAARDLPDEVEGFEVEILEVPLSGPPASRFGEGADHTLNPAEALLVERLLVSGAAHDPTLSRLARELARTSPDSQHVPGDLVDAVLAWAGLVDPRPRLSLTEFEDPGHRCGGRAQGVGCVQALEGVAEAMLGALRGEDVYFGVGLSPVEGGDLTRLVVAISERHIQLEPTPSVVPPEGQIELRGRLLGAYRRPWLEVVDAAGQASSIEVTGGASGFSATVPCGGRGVARVEALAEGGFGPQVVALFPLYCGVEPPRTARVELERLGPEVGLDEVVRASFALHNQTRRRAGLEPLRWSEGAAEAARAHSEEMVALGYVGHRSPRTGTAADRLRRAGVGFSLVRENIARGYGPRGMHQGLMGSPGHRANLLSEEVAFVGIGAAWARDPGQTEGSRRPILLTQNLFAPRGADTPDDPLAELRAAIVSARQAAGLSAPRWDQGLSQAAQQLAEGVAADREEAALRRYHAALQGGSYRRVQTQQIVAAQFRTLAELDLWTGPLPGAVGLGLARIEEGDHRDALVLVVSVGR